MKTSRKDQFPLSTMKSESVFPSFGMTRVEKAKNGVGSRNTRRPTIREQFNILFIIPIYM